MLPGLTKLHEAKTYPQAQHLWLEVFTNTTQHSSHAKSLTRRRWRRDVRRRRWRNIGRWWWRRHIVVRLLLLLPRRLLASITTTATIATAILLPRSGATTVLILLPWRKTTSRWALIVAAAVVATLARLVPRSWVGWTLAAILPWGRTASGTTLPWTSVARVLAVLIATLPGVPSNLSCWVLTFSTANLLHQVVIVGIDAISSRTAWWKAAWILATSTIWTVTRHVSGVAAHATDYVRGEVTLLWTVVLAVTDLAAILAGLILVVTEGTVESSEFTELVALKLILSFWDGGGLQQVSIREHAGRGSILTVSIT